MLGLSDTEQKIYRILMVSGQLSAGELRYATALDAETTESSLNSLVTKKLVRIVPGLDGRYAPVLPIGNLKEKIEESVSSIDTLPGEISTKSEAVVSDLKTQLDGKIQEYNTLVEEKLAACVNIHPIQSIYRWHGKIEEEGEMAVWVKTRAELADRVIERVKELHSYEVPCIVSLPIEKGYPDYLKWIEESTG